VGSLEVCQVMVSDSAESMQAEAPGEVGVHSSSVAGEGGDSGAGEAAEEVPQETPARWSQLAGVPETFKPLCCGKGEWDSPEAPNNFLKGWFFSLPLLLCFSVCVCDCVCVCPFVRVRARDDGE
jgi:hypothetical protein